MNALGMIADLRGGIPPGCDFCGKEYTSDRWPIPEEAGEWTCSECWQRWEKEDTLKRAELDAAARKGKEGG